MAKIISQSAFEGYYGIEILGDLERLRLALDGIDDEELMRKLERSRGHGRDKFPVRVMWNLIIAMKVFGHLTVESFRRELDRNPTLARICGLRCAPGSAHVAPPARVFSGFIKRLKKEQAEIDHMFAGQVAELRELLPDFGKTVAGDGKYIDSIAKKPAKEMDETDDRSESDAKFSLKEYHYTGTDGKPHVKKETHFGFKAHVICDVETELPIAFSVTAANADEKAQMKTLINSLPPEQQEQIGYVLLDRGYDSTEMIRCIKGIGAAPVIDIRNLWKDKEETKQYKDTKIIYTFNGAVYYEDDDGKHKMAYEGFDRQKKCLRYSYKGKTYKIYISYDERVFLPVARDSMKFERLYKARTTVERLNSRLDRDYMFEDHFIRGLDKMKLMVSLSFVIMNGMALEKIKRGVDSIRSLKRAGPLPAA